MKYHVPDKYIRYRMQFVSRKVPIFRREQGSRLSDESIAVPVLIMIVF